MVFFKKNAPLGLFAQSTCNSLAKNIIITIDDLKKYVDLSILDYDIDKYTLKYLIIVI